MTSEIAIAEQRVRAGSREVLERDGRLLTKGYGPAVLRSLPPATVRKLPAAELSTAVAGWLDRRAGGS